jgi:hypothetical protein
MQVLLPVLEKRARMVPNLWRDIRMVQTRLDGILSAILSTCPPEKLRHISADVRNTQLYVRVEAPGLHSQSTEGFSYTPTRTINNLLGYLVEHECMMCDKTPVEARKCPMRKIIDSALPHEVNTPDGEHCRYSDMAIGLIEEGTA